MTEDEFESKTITIEAVKALYQLWANENRIKTQKLTMFFTAQSILISAFTLGSGIRYLIPVVGTAFSLFWFFSIGRTVAFQKLWRGKIDERLGDAPQDIGEQFGFYPTAQDKRGIPFYGKMSGKYILLFPPAVAFLLWFGILVYGLACLISRQSVETIGSILWHWR